MEPSVRIKKKPAIKVTFLLLLWSTLIGYGLFGSYFVSSSVSAFLAFVILLVLRKSIVLGVRGRVGKIYRLIGMIPSGAVASALIAIVLVHLLWTGKADVNPKKVELADSAERRQTANDERWEIGGIGFSLTGKFPNTIKVDRGNIILGSAEGKWLNVLVDTYKYGKGSYFERPRVGIRLKPLEYSYRYEDHLRLLGTGIGVVPILMKQREVSMSERIYHFQEGSQKWFVRQIRSRGNLTMFTAHLFDDERKWIRVVSMLSNDTASNVYEEMVALLAGLRIVGGKTIVPGSIEEVM